MHLCKYKAVHKNAQAHLCLSITSVPDLWRLMTKQCNLFIFSTENMNMDIFIQTWIFLLQMDTLLFHAQYVLSIP